MKVIEFTRPLFSSPPPYYQVALVKFGSSDGILSSYAARTTPNIQRPGQDDAPNLEEYPVVTQGIYKGKVLFNGFKGTTAILLEDGGNVPIFQRVNPRYPDQGGFATEIFLHEAQKASWPGSAGCLTLAPGGAIWLEQVFLDGESVTVYVPGIDPGYLLEDVADAGRF